jgi:hypothetical protein
MGFLKKLAGFGKKLLGPVVGAGKALVTLRDKGIGLFNKVKDALPTPLKSAIDSGLEWAMNTPVGTALKKASGLLDTGVTMADAAHQKLSEYESQGGPPMAAQLQAIGERANQSEKPGADAADDQQASRLANLKQE